MNDLNQEIMKKENIECFVCGNIIQNLNMNFIDKILEIKYLKNIKRMLR